jgi:DNA processing protein
VFAIPGSIYSDKSIGCNNLIKNNIAHLVINYEDIVNSLNLKKKDGNNNEKSNDIKNKDKNIEEILNFLGEDYINIYNFIKEKKISNLDSIIENFYDIPESKISTILLKLEMKNIITQLPGNNYQTT